MARTRTFLAIGLAGAVVATVAAAPELRAIAANFPLLHLGEDRATQNLRVFDAVWTIVDRRFYDQAKTGPTWDAARASWRPKAAETKSTAALYYDVLTPMLMELRSSHVGVEMPPGSTFTRNDPALKGKPFILRSPRGDNLCAPAGFDCAPLNGKLVVLGVQRGGPAALAGVEPGAEVTNLALGKTSARFTLERADGTRSAVEYEFTEPPRMERTAKPLGPGVLLVRFDEFDPETVGWALDQIRTASPKAVVLDFRHNSGGEVVSANRFMEAFLPAGASLGRDVRGDGRPFDRVAKNVEHRFGGRVAVLVGPFSNSSAEVVAAVFKHHRRACLVGLHTPGNVLTAYTFALPDGGELQIPIAEYHTPADGVLEGAGVAPDIEAIETPAALRAGVDLAVKRAVQTFGEGCASGDGFRWGGR